MVSFCSPGKGAIALHCVTPYNPLTRLQSAITAEAPSRPILSAAGVTVDIHALAAALVSNNDAAVSSALVELAELTGTGAG